MTCRREIETLVQRYRLAGGEAVRIELDGEGRIDAVMCGGRRLDPLSFAEHARAALPAAL